MTPADIHRILVIKLRHIGDVLLTTPVYRAIKSKLPETHTSVLVNSGTEQMMTGNPNIDEIIVFDRSIKKLPLIKRFKSETFFLREIRDRGFDTTIDLTGGDRGAIASYFCGAGLRIGRHTHKFSLWGKKTLYTDLTRVDHTQHVVVQNLQMLKTLSINDVQRHALVEIHVPDEVMQTVSKALEARAVCYSDTLVHMHPMSRWFFKCWKDDYTAEIITWLNKNGVKVILTAAPDAKERERLERIVSLTALSATERNGGLITLDGSISLKTLAAISARCAVFFGVDSAPMHIAAAVNTPVAALFGPTCAFNWGPWDNEARSLHPYPHRSGVQICGIHTVIQRDWPCIPCNQDGCNGSKISNCLDDITPDEVKQALTKKLNNRTKKEGGGLAPPQTPL
ncbi:MAG: putative lipopolysaccharide heptosyltransferase III [Nitrospirae bacterium]|nr:putative lipopolysaccharide heptosyltransferase III [Nitrospirota bacterium]